MTPTAKYKKIALIAGVLLLLFAAIVAAAVFALRPSGPCPMELIVAQRDQLFLPGGPKKPAVWERKVTVRNRDSRIVRMDNAPKAEVKVAGHWKKVTVKFWMMEFLLPASGSGNSQDAWLILPPDAQAVRIQIKYRTTPGSLPLGIGDVTARWAPPGRTARWLQNLTRLFSTKLYDWLWPPGDVTANTPGWQTATMEANVPKDNHAAPTTPATNGGARPKTSR